MGKQGEKFNFGKFYTRYGTFMLLLVIFVASMVCVPNFLGRENLTNILRQIAVVTILAFGVQFVIILGHINVALGSEIALIGCVSCLVMVNLQDKIGSLMGLITAIAVALLVGIAIGAINGFVITHFKIPAFIMTLGVTEVARGFSLILTSGKPVSGMDASFKFLGQGYILGVIPVSVMVMILVFAVCWIILNKNKFGRHLYAVGGNINAAEASGIKVKMVVRKAFIIDGICAAIAGVLFMSRLGTGQPSSGVTYEFKAITACVVGGTSLAGGSGSLVGTLIGSVIVGIIENVQTLLGINAYWQQVVRGLIILIAVIIDVVTKRAAAKSK
ncbi:inositol transport system permease protein [Lachnospiraceae bacterium PF1-21]|uniref:ABC transporter permease n=1 Tax=Ohessyouella blattaphilus TaxID=2949333 RepID=UPI003E2BA9FB